MTPEDRLNDQLARAMEAHVATGRKPVVPFAGQEIWNIYMEISRTRTWHQHGPNPIPWGEIAAWSKLMRWPLEPHHVKQIQALDAAWLAATFAKLKGDQSRQVVGDLTTEALDAILG